MNEGIVSYENICGTWLLIKKMIVIINYPSVSVYYAWNDIYIYIYMIILMPQKDNYVSWQNRIGDTFQMILHVETDICTI